MLGTAGLDDLRVLSNLNDSRVPCSSDTTHLKQKFPSSSRFMNPRIYRKCIKTLIFTP